MGVMEAVLIPVEGKIADLTAEPELASEGPTWVVFNCKKSTGYFTITKMTMKAIEKADQYIGAIKGCKKRPGVKEIYTPDEWGLKKIYREKNVQVDIMEDHLIAFKGFVEKYGLSYSGLEKKWNELISG